MSVKEKRVADALNAVSKANIRGAFEDGELNKLIADYFGGDDVESECSDSENDSDGESLHESGDETAISGDDDSPDHGDDALVTATEVSDIIHASSRYTSSSVCEENETEMERIEGFKCGCTLDHGNQCCKQFSPNFVLNRRLEMQEFSEGTCT